MEAKGSTGQRLHPMSYLPNRRRSTSPFCRITGNSHYMDDHHYVPSPDDFPRFERRSSCRITEKNHYFKDYKYLYPIIDKDGATRMITEHDFHCRITAKYRAMSGYKYVYPVLGASTNKKKDDMISAIEDEKFENILIPSEVEQIVRGGIDDILKAKDSEYIFISSKEGELFPAALKEIPPRKRKVLTKFERRHTLPVALEADMLLELDVGPPPPVKKIKELKAPPPQPHLNGHIGKEAEEEIVTKIAEPPPAKTSRGRKNKKRNDLSGKEKKPPLSNGVPENRSDGEKIVQNGQMDVAEEKNIVEAVKPSSRLSRMEKYKLQFQTLEQPKDAPGGNRLMLFGAYDKDDEVELDFGDCDESKGEGLPQKTSTVQFVSCHKFSEESSVAEDHCESTREGMSAAANLSTIIGSQEDIQIPPAEDNWEKCRDKVFVNGIGDSETSRESELAEAREENLSSLESTNSTHFDGEGRVARKKRDGGNGIGCDGSLDDQGRRSEVKKMNLLEDHPRATCRAEITETVFAERNEVGERGGGGSEHCTEERRDDGALRGMESNTRLPHPLRIIAEKVQTGERGLLLLTEEEQEKEEIIFTSFVPNGDLPLSGGSVSVTADTEGSEKGVCIANARESVSKFALKSSSENADSSLCTLFGSIDEEQNHASSDRAGEEGKVAVHHSVATISRKEILETERSEKKSLEEIEKYERCSTGVEISDTSFRNVHSAIHSNSDFLLANDGMTAAKEDQRNGLEPLSQNSIQMISTDSRISTDDASVDGSNIQFRCFVSGELMKNECCVVSSDSRVSQRLQCSLPITTSLLLREALREDSRLRSQGSVRSLPAGGGATMSEGNNNDSTKNDATSTASDLQGPDVYVAIMEFKPMESDEESIPMKEGQEVEILDASKPRRWFVRTRPMTADEESTEGWVPACYLEKSTAQRMQSYMITEVTADPKEQEAMENRESVVKELVETEEDFARDMQYVVDNYYKQMDNPRVPKELKDRKGSIFGNFKDICDFHNNVLMKGVHYHAKEPTKLGKTFLRLERDFDMHSTYCWNECRAQQLLKSGRLKEYFDDHSKMIDDDKILSDHLKLPIQRLNDYQLLLREIIKYSARLNEDTSDLQKALDFIHSINKRNKDLQFIQAIQGCSGNLLKLGRIIKHDMFDVTEGNEPSREKYVFLFKGRVFITDKRTFAGKDTYQATNIFKLQEVEIVDSVADDHLKILVRHTKKSRSGFPLALRARTLEQKENWAKELTVGAQTAEDLGEDEPVLAEAAPIPLKPEGKRELELEEPKTLESEPKSSNVVESKPQELKHKVEEQETRHPSEPEAKRSKVVEPEAVVVKKPEESSVKEETAPVQKKASKEKKEEEQKEKKEKEEPKIKEEEVPKEKKKEAPKEKQTEALKEKKEEAPKEKKTEAPKEKKEEAPKEKKAEVPKEKKEEAPKEKKVEAPEEKKEEAPKERKVEVPKEKKEEAPKEKKVEAPEKKKEEAPKEKKVEAPEEKKEEAPKEKKVEAPKEKKEEAPKEKKVEAPKEKREEAPKEKKVEAPEEKKEEAPKEKKVEAPEEKKEEAPKEKKVEAPKEKKEEAPKEKKVETPKEKKAEAPKEKKEEAPTKKPAPEPKVEEKELKSDVSKELPKEKSTPTEVSLKQPEPAVQEKPGKEDKTAGDKKKVIESEIKSKEPEKPKPPKAVKTAKEAEMADKPRFTKTLRGVTCALGEVASLECETEGTPAPSVTWLKDNQRITKSNRIQTSSKGKKHSLTIKDATADDAGLYTVVASNSQGSASCSAPLNLKVALLGLPKEDSRPTTPGGTILPHAPLFKVKLKDTQLLEGTSVRFELVVRGSPEPTVKFYKDNKELKQDDRVRVSYESKEVFELILDHVNTKDGGTYSCVATNSEGKDTTTGTLSITKHKDVFKGLEEELEEEREPTPRPRTPKFKWFKNGQDFEASERFQVMFNEQEDSLALLFQHVTPDDAGLYTCVASTSTGSKIACSAELTVQGVIRQVEAPSIKAQLADVEASEGGSAMLELKITGYPKPKVTWLHKKKEVETGGRFRFLFADEESFTLVIKNVKKEDAGQYTVKASNEMGEVESSCQLTVKSAPAFLKGLSDMAVMTDETVKFEVEVDGNPVPEIKWYKDGQQLSSGDRIKIAQRGQKHTLEVSKAKSDDSGSYSCVLTNSLGSQAGFSNLLVKASPTFLKEMQNVEGLEGNTLQFTVEISGNPKPTIKWSKDGKELKIDSKHVKVVDEGANTYSLIVDKISSTDSGVYTCELRNEHGIKASSGNLALKTKPEFIKKLSDMEAKERDAGVEFNVTLKGHPYPSVKWLLDGADLTENKNFVISSEKDLGSHTLKLKKVSRNLSGKYTCEASNVMGTTVTSGVLSVHVPIKKPEFEQSLKPGQLVEGKPGKLEAKISGEPRPTITWLKDGKEVKPGAHFTYKEEPDGTVLLLIDNVTPDDAGTYTIVAISDQGEAKCEAPITTIPPGKKPEFLKELQKANLLEGQPLKLEAQVNGKPTSIKWQKDGEELFPNDHVVITQEPDGTIALKIDQVNRNDAGKYTVIAINAEGKSRSAALVEIKAVSKPEIILGLEPLILTDGQTGQLKMKVSGEPKPTIQWLKDGKELKPSNRIQAEEGPDGVATLTINNARPEDAGKYSVIVGNFKGEVRSSAPVNVNQAPTFQKHLGPVEVIEGYPAKLEAKLTGSPPPVIRWLKDGKELSPDGLHIKEVHIPDGSVALLIDNCKVEDAGKYTLAAKNSFGEDSSVGDLSVFDKGRSDEPESVPKFLGPVGDLSVKEGDPIRFEAAICGNPLPDITWVFNDEPLNPSDNILMTFDGKKAILEIKNSTPEDIGKYQCHLKNPLGKASSEGSASVLEKTAPRFIQRLIDFNGFINKPLKLMCRVKGYPEPEIDWYFNGSRIDSGIKYNRTKVGDSHSLSIESCESIDSGIYECRATNSVGEDSSRAAVNISDKVEKGEAPMFLKKIGDTEVIEGMTARFTACITGIPTPDVIWSKDSQPLESSSRHKMELESTGILRLVIRDLETSDYGEYSVAISNIHGSATCSAHLRPDSLDQKYITPIGNQFVDFDKFKKTGAPVPLPDKPRIVRMNDNYLTLAWKPSVPNAPRVPVTYQIEMAKHPEGDWELYRTGLKDTLCDVRGLVPRQDYKFRIRVENKYGVSEPSPYTTAHCSKLYESLIPADFKPKDYELEHPALEKYAAPPRFVRREEDSMYGVRGHPVTIEFWLYGHPQPEVTWFKDESKIEKGKYDFLQDRNGKVSLFINKMDDDYVGTYLCNAINDEGEARMKIKLLLAEIPVFIKRLDETTAMARRSGRMECRVIGLPYPKIKWYRDWHPLYESERTKIFWEEPNRCTLYISGLITRDAGLYSCSATNIAGTSSSSAALNVEDSEDIFDIKTYSRPISVKPRSKPFEDYYDIGEELGRGTQGITYHSVKRDTGNSYATKMMNGKGKFKDFMKSEIDIMNQLCHPNLIRLWDAFETKNSLTLLTDICGGGELLDNILRRGTLTEREVAYYIKQLLEGLDHMHSRYIGHLGLTVGDMLVARVNSYDIKVGDFGLGARLHPGKEYFSEYGHPEFVAPEIANKLPATLLSDLWSVGVITYLLLSGISPFLGENDRETLTRVQQGKINFFEDAFMGVTDDAKDFMSKLLVFNPNGRMDVKTALQHKWIKYYADTPKPLDKPLNNVDRLKDYYKKWKNWYANAACKTSYRRRTLESCFHHPSRMIYPPGESYTPPSSPEPETDRSHVKPSQFDDITFQQKINREGIDVQSESNYQGGPDTYLLQLRDTDFPLRVRQYLRVGASTSPSLAANLRDKHWGDSTLVIRERRRFVDIMDEEIDDERKGLTTRTVPMRLYHEIGTMGYAHEQMEFLKREVWKDKGPREVEIGMAPYVREKIKDVVMKEGDEVIFRCYAVGSPKPNYSWFRNDGILLESSRIMVKELKDGRCELRMNPSRAYDAGVYKCVARNMHGVTVCRARLKIGDKPGRPEAPEMRKLSDTEIYLTWATPRDEGHSPVLCYGLEYKKSDENVWTCVGSNIGHEFFVIRNLMPSTFYQFRVKALNKFGWGEPGFSTEPISTKEEGAEKVKVSPQRKYQQELTEQSSEYEIEDTGLPEIDYSREKNPVPLQEGDPTELYRFVAEISRGRYSVLMKVWVKDSGSTSIAKVIQSTPETASSVQREYDIIKSLCHEKIVNLESASCCGEKTVLVMEKLSGIDVLTYLSLRQDYNEELIVKIIKQVLEAVEYLHFRGICYIELQPDNVVMVDQRLPDIKLVDFGSARFVQKSGAKVDVQGTLEYLAPEVLKNEDVSTLTDIWAVGVLTYILLSGTSPFRGQNDEETKDNVIFVRYQFENLYKDVTTEATRFLMHTFKSCPIKRSTVEECLENKWLVPSEYMIMKRESALFLPDKLREFSKQFHATKSAATNPEMLTSLGMSSSRSEPLEDEF